MRNLATLATFAALATFLAGCGSTPTGPVTPPMEEGDYVIRLTAANTFIPADAKVPVGATVIFHNDGGTHDVTAKDGSFSSDSDLGKKMAAGDRYEHTFTQAGTIVYECLIHASIGMKGTLHVE